MIAFNADFHSFEYPALGTPDWATQVDRWYQMDAPSYGLCELWANSEKLKAPDMILLGSAGGSNAADQAFVSGGAMNPARFVYTLPSIRSSALLRLMNWHGPLLCVQKDPSTLASALLEAAGLMGEMKTLWILGVNSTTNHLAYRLCISENGRFEMKKGSGRADIHDLPLLTFLRKPGAKALALGGGYEIAIKEHA